MEASISRATAILLLVGLCVGIAGAKQGAARKPGRPPSAAEQMAARHGVDYYHIRIDAEKNRWRGALPTFFNLASRDLFDAESAEEYCGDIGSVLRKQGDARCAAAVRQLNAAARERAFAEIAYELGWDENAAPGKYPQLFRMFKGAKLERAIAGKTMVFEHEDFAPAALSHELLGPGFYRWDGHGYEGFDTRIPVVIYHGMSLEAAKRMYPVSRKQNLDYRYVPADKALRFLRQQIAALGRDRGNTEINARVAQRYRGLVRQMERGLGKERPRAAR